MEAKRGPRRAWTSPVSRSRLISIGPTSGISMRSCSARGEGVVEADALGGAEQVDLFLHALVGLLPALQVQAQAQAQHLVAQAHGEERPALAEQRTDGQVQVADLRLADLGGVAGRGP